MPANLAIAVHPEETYTALEVDDGGWWWPPARGRGAELPGVAGRARAQLALPGSASRAGGPASVDRARRPIVAAEDFVAMDAGTGLVHIAPGHGEEDYESGRRAGLRIYNPVDDDGRFIAEVAHFAGQTVWEANPKIIAHLAGWARSSPRCR